MPRNLGVSLRRAACFAGFTILYLPASSLAAGLTPDARAELAGASRVTAALINALEQQDTVVARIYFLPSTSPVLKRNASRDGGEVSPLVVELAQAMLPGELGLLHLKSLDALQGTVNARVVQMLLRNPQVVGMDLETDPPKPRAVPTTKVLCSATSTRACVQSGRFSLQVIVSSTAVPVATSGSDSAVFWFYSSSNWEVLAKVLNACGINNRYWIFGAGATSTAYSLSVVDWVSGGSASYNGAVCPIVDTGGAGVPGFPC
jgi:hypothetical protein